MDRYRFYREHKLVCSYLSQFEQEVAKTDFNRQEAVVPLIKQFSNLKNLLRGHAQHEDESIHALLRQKDSRIHDDIETDHREQDRLLDELGGQLEVLQRDARTQDGQEFYLAFRAFHAKSLIHMNEEETKIMPELWRLYSNDTDLRSVDRKTYELMTPDELAGMIEHLHPHLNENDLSFFFEDIRQSQPEKFANMLSLLKKNPDISNRRKFSEWS